MEKIDLKSIFTQVDSLIRSENEWCQRTAATDADGRRVDPDSRQAVCWCLSGAIRRVCGSASIAFVANAAFNTFICDHYADRIYDRMRAIVNLNDATDFHTVKKALREFIQTL
jgi:hypothetical protein